MKDILRNTKPWKATEKDNTPEGLLKACGKPLYRILAALITSSFKAAYFPRCFKTAKIILLPKPNKTTAQKSTPGAWRLISLLNSLSKIVEATFARRITNAVEAEHLLPDGQMGNRFNRSTDLAVRIMVEIATKARKRVGIALLLQFDIKTFDAMHHQWINQILRLTEYPEWC
jgi:hypothetical protein